MHWIYPVPGLYKNEGLAGLFPKQPCRYKSCTSKLRRTLGEIDGGRGDLRVCDIPRFLH